MKTADITLPLWLAVPLAPFVVFATLHTVAEIVQALVGVLR